MEQLAPCMRVGRLRALFHDDCRTRPQARFLPDIICRGADPRRGRQYLENLRRARPRWGELTNLSSPKGLQCHVKIPTRAM
eukprot:5708051-Pyramimonas_sp.AAC.1